MLQAELPAASDPERFDPCAGCFEAVAESGVESLEIVCCRDSPVNQFAESYPGIGYRPDARTLLGVAHVVFMKMRHQRIIEIRRRTE